MKNVIIAMFLWITLSMNSASCEEEYQKYTALKEEYQSILNLRQKAMNYIEIIAIQDTSYSDNTYTCGEFNTAERLKITDYYDEIEARQFDYNFDLQRLDYKALNECHPELEELPVLEHFSHIDEIDYWGDYSRQSAYSRQGGMDEHGFEETIYLSDVGHVFIGCDYAHVEYLIPYIEKLCWKDASGGWLSKKRIIENYQIETHEVRSIIREHNRIYELFYKNGNFLDTWSNEDYFQLAISLKYLNAGTWATVPDIGDAYAIWQLRRCGRFVDFPLSNSIYTPYPKMKTISRAVPDGNAIACVYLGEEQYHHQYLVELTEGPLYYPYMSYHTAIVMYGGLANRDFGGGLSFHEINCAENGYPDWDYIPPLSDKWNKEEVFSSLGLDYFRRLPFVRHVLEGVSMRK